jgi:hypothetical protein
MTNTLHRYGAAETLADDFIVFAMAARGLNDRQSAVKYRRFLEIASKHHPINLGDASKGGLYRPSKGLNPLAHWFRKDERNASALIRSVEAPTVVSAVFDDPSFVLAFLREIKQVNLGLSINISSLTDRAEELARQAGIIRHSVEYSLGFFGALDKLPERPVLQLSTMCGHGMISFGFAKKMMNWVKEGRRTADDTSRYMARFCTCGVFNTTRATRIMRECCRRG